MAITFQGKSVSGLEGGVSGLSGFFCPRDLDMK